MKTFIPAILVLAALALLVGVGSMSTSLFESPEDAFRLEMDEKVEQAQRMLNEYEGGQPLLAATLERLSAIKAEPVESAAGGEDSALANRPNYQAEWSRDLERRRSELERQLSSMGGGEAAGAASVTSNEALRQQIDANANLLNRALQTVREAVNASSTDGSLSGRSNPVATRLEAVLIYHLANLKRREAAVQWARAEAEQSAFRAALADWRQADNRVRRLKTELAGTGGRTMQRQVGAPADHAVEQPAPQPEQKPQSPPAAASTPPAAQQGEQEDGWLSGIAHSLVTGGKASIDSAKPGPAPAGNLAENADQPNNPDEARPAPTTKTGPITIDAIPSVDERIRQLQAQAQQADAQIAQAQAQVDRLTAQVQERQARLDKARAEADAAERRMMELEDAGFDPADPDGLSRFTEQYNQAAEAHRRALREALALEHGTIRNARPDAHEENEILTAPLVPVEKGAQLRPEIGLTALQADLRAATGLLETGRKLRQQIDTQIKTLQAVTGQVQKDLSQAESWRSALATEAAAHARNAIAAAAKAEAIENEALQILETQGQAAAQRAQQAARERGSEIQTFHQQQASGTPQVAFMMGHAQAVAGDLEMERALILAQQANALQRHGRLLTALGDMGIAPVDLLSAGSEDQTAANVPAGTPTTQPQSIAQAAEARRTEALKAAEAALENYNKASGTLGRLWLVHTQIGAVHYLMASLTTGNESQQHRAEALKEYQLAIRDRADSPEARPYRTLVDTLSRQ